MKSRQTRITREKLLVFCMVNEVLNKHYQEKLLLWDGTIEVMGRFDPRSRGRHMDRQLRMLTLLGEYPQTARAYEFKGGIVLGDSKHRTVTVNCTILENGNKPRAAEASVVIDKIVYWYEFLHCDGNDKGGHPTVCRYIEIDPLSPHLEKA